jgi:uncharacterized protein YkwD
MIRPVLGLVPSQPVPLLREAPRRMARWLLAASLAACASAGSTPPSARPSVRFTAPGVPAETYRSEPAPGDALRGPHALRVGRGIERASADASHPLTPDARLGQLAAWIGDALDAQGAPPPYPVIDLWAHHLGLPEPAPHLLVLTQADGARLEERTAAELASMLPQQRYTHYGAATLERGGAVLAVIVLSWRWLELHPLPRAVPAGASVVLEGRLWPGLSAPTLVVSYPDGTSQRSAPDPGPAFALPVPLRGRGEHRIELLASSELGDTVVANFPLYVGVPVATEVAMPAASSSDATLDQEETKQRLLALINADRAHARLPTLALDDALGRVAQAHTADMQAHGFVGHTSKTTGGAEDRVRTAGIRTPLVLENIGRGYSPSEVHRGLMESPGHRENLLNPQATHVGIGVVITREDSRAAFLVTELFTRFAQPIDVGKAPAQLREALNRERVRRGLPELRDDAALSELCAQAAREFFQAPRHEAQREVVVRLNQRAASSHPPYPRLGALMTVVTSLDEATTLTALLDPKARALGLSVAQGTRDDTIERAIVVVALIGY